MIPKELMIDNWVLYDGRPFKIYGISKEYPFLDTIEFGSGVVEWKDLQPIPLTEEILLKCGFEFDIINSDGSLIMPLNTKCRDGHIDYFYIKKHQKNLKIRSIRNIEIKHLHQLQNLYWCLCGEELTVNL